MDHLGPKMAHPHNSGSAIRIVLQFRKMEGANRDMEIILTFFLRKKSYLGQFGNFDQKMVHPHNFGSALSFLNFAQ